MALVRCFAPTPNYRYLFGAVSISDAYPEVAKDMILHFYQTHFPAHTEVVKPLYPYPISAEKKQELDKLFPGTNYRPEFTELKSRLSNINLSVPTLFKQYADLTVPGGVILTAGGYDIGFSNAVDAFVQVDTWKLTPTKRDRYVQTPSPLSGLD